MLLKNNNNLVVVSFRLIAVCIYRLVMISIDLSETTQERALEI